MKADYKTKNSSKTIILDVDVAELVIITKGIKDQLKFEKDYLQFYKEELINPTIKCNPIEEIEKCNAKIKKLQDMLNELKG